MTQCLYDEGINFKVKTVYDGAVYNLIGEDCVVGNVNNEFGESHSSTSLTITIGTGFGFIGGGYFAHETSVQLDAEASSELYVVARIDKTRTDGLKAQVELKTEVQLKFEDLNGTGNVRDLLLYKITTNGEGITDVEDLRKIKTSHGKYVNELAIVGTPQALVEPEAWDVDEEYGYYLDIQVIGVYDTDYISNIVLKSDFEGASVITTLRNKIRFYFTDATAVNTKAYDLVIIGR